MGHKVKWPSNTTSYGCFWVSRTGWCLLNITELFLLFLSRTKWPDPQKKWGSDKSDKENAHILQKLFKPLKFLTGNLYGSTSGFKKLPQHCLEKEKALIKWCFSCTLSFLVVACFLHGIQMACRGFLVSAGDLLSFTRCFLLSTPHGLFIRVHWEGSDLLLAEGMWVQQPCLLWLCRKFTPRVGSISELMLVVFYSCPCHLSHPHTEALECAPHAEAMSIATTKEHHSFISAF